MELGQLRTFRVVAETLNFTRGAQRLGLTQSAVSHQIKALETELGEPLFVRTKRGALLAPAGQEALELAGRVLDAADALLERFAGPQRVPAGRVRAAAATQAFAQLFAPLFEEFMRTHPAVELTFRTTASTDQTVADILAGAAEVGFASLPIYSPALRVDELFEDELVLVVAPGHRLVGLQVDVEVRELEEERFILIEPGASIRRATDAFFDRVGLRPRLALESNDTFFVKLMVEHGVGLSLLPAWAVREEAAAGRLERMRIAGERLKRKVALLGLGGAQPRATLTFVDFMLERRSELQALATAGLLEPESAAKASRARPSNASVSPGGSARGRRGRA